MTLASPYPNELLAVARKVFWYETPEDGLSDLPSFLVQLMVFGSSEDIAIAERFIPADAFEMVLKNPPPGVFTQEVWERWHRQFHMSPILPLPSAHLS